MSVHRLISNLLQAYHIFLLNETLPIVHIQRNLSISVGKHSKVYPHHFFSYTLHSFFDPKKPISVISVQSVYRLWSKSKKINWILSAIYFLYSINKLFYSIKEILVFLNIQPSFGRNVKLWFLLLCTAVNTHTNVIVRHLAF